MESIFLLPSHTSILSRSRGAGQTTGSWSNDSTTIEHLSRLARHSITDYIFRLSFPPRVDAATDVSRASLFFASPASPSPHDDDERSRSRDGSDASSDSDSDAGGDVVDVDVDSVIVKAGHRRFEIQLERV